MSQDLEMKKKFNEYSADIIQNKNKNCVYLSDEEYLKIIDEVCIAKVKKKNKTCLEYRRLQRYDVITIGKVKKLISPLKKNDESVKYFVSNGELFDVIHGAHLNVGHGGRNKVAKEINQKYVNVTTEMIMLYLSLCESCQKKSKRKGLVVKSSLASEFNNSRCQIDLIDLQIQADGDYKFILNYQDLQTKFVVLRPLKTKTAVEVASNVMDIFTTFGAPSILHSDNGIEFVNTVITELSNLWDGIKIVPGCEQRHSQNQDFVERANQDIENILVTLMNTKSTKKWSDELKFVQMLKNRSYYEGIKQSPFEALFGTKMKLGLKTWNFSDEVLNEIESEDQLEDLINKATLDGNLQKVTKNQEAETLDQDEKNDNLNSSSEGTAAETENLNFVEPKLEHDDLEELALDQDQENDHSNPLLVTEHLPTTSNHDLLHSMKVQISAKRKEAQSELQAKKMLKLSNQRKTP